MLEFIPDVQRLTNIFAQATAPTFFLGAVAGFVSLMSSRLAAITARMQKLNGIKDDDERRLKLKRDIVRLRRRARLLNGGIASSLVAGICATGLLVILFASEFFGLRYAYGAGFLFACATFALGVGLVRFFQETRMGLSEADEYE
ncbi:DUF2721 domain-containing protein [Alsobacter sp. KACC 23698]|uniref:DUF2721 domain-containing protein n=1 Tax=Alsobacter sp. KACC 23698 TaxID=3149229 RepID=A0AAU7JEP3_9HYPH